MINIPIEVSARHIHLSTDDLAILFGPDYTLRPIKNLSQPGQFAAEEVVEIQTTQSWGLPPHQDFTFGKSCDRNQIRVLGPVRLETQLELSWSDFMALGLEPAVALSGDRPKSSVGSVVILGPAGEIKLEQGIIIARRHIHCHTKKAAEYGLRDKQVVAVQTTDTVRQVTFHQVIVRVSPDFDWQMHIDTDEANAAGIGGSGVGSVII